MPDRDNEWSKEENELIVADYLAMLFDEISGRTYNKAAHNRALLPRLRNRSRGSIEWKHRNISAVLIELGCQYISGYQPATEYQRSLVDVVVSRLTADVGLRDLLAHDADRPMVAPVIANILDIVTPPPQREKNRYEQVADPDSVGRRTYRRANYLERESRNRMLGEAGEIFALTFERARLQRSGRDDLAGRIEHVASTRGDGDGFDILSFEDTGEERFIEVKTTKYGQYTPFFVSQNELRVSRSAAERYHLYRFYDFRERPQLFQLQGDLAERCQLTATTYKAEVG